MKRATAEVPLLPTCRECGDPLPYRETRYVVPPEVAEDGRFRLANEADLAFGLVACGSCTVREHRRLTQACRKEQGHAA